MKGLVKAIGGGVCSDCYEWVLSFYDNTKRGS